MALDNLDDIPAYPFPEGFKLETLGTRDFYELHKRTGPTRQIDKDIVEVQYRGDRSALSDRCLFLFNKNEIIGAGIAWWNPNVLNERWGVVDWLSINSQYQAMGLSRPFLSAVLKRISNDDHQCYADTQTNNLAAIRLALSFGFKPKYNSKSGLSLWRGVARKLNHVKLTKLLVNYDLT
jgi:RimJ/RimL family protein N-acetyltransferase